MKQNNFAVLILTYKRPFKVYTYKTLKKCGYTGKIYLISDTQDPTLRDYQDQYKDEFFVFNRAEYQNKFDIGDNFKTMKGVVYARNAVFDIARKLKLQYFLVLDDDYTSFNYRFDHNFNYKFKEIKKLDRIFNILLEFYKNNNIKTLTFAQGGDYIGGSLGSFGQNIFLKRKAMNSFICAVDRPFEVLGRINEDVNTYVVHGSRGGLFFTTNQISLQQQLTQSNSGGLTEQYKDDGTFVKSFYTIMMHPSSVKINLMGNKNRRLHHSIKWDHTVPKILRG